MGSTTPGIHSRPWARKLRHDSLTRPLYQASYSYQNLLDEQPFGLAASASRTRIAHLPAVRQEGDGELALEIFDAGDCVRLVAGFDSCMFDTSTVRRMLAHFVRLVEAVIARPDARIASLDLLSAAERNRILMDWSRGAEPGIQPGIQPGIRDGCVHQWIQQRAARTPDAIALISGEQGLSYRDLLSRANRLAAHLRARGVGLGVPVAVCLSRGLESVIALLAVLKSGGVWVPLDASDPDQRLSLILADAGVAAIIADASTQDRLAKLGHRVPVVVRLDRERRAIDKRSSRAPSVSIPLESPAYIIYTSGSTGRPKGVIVSHRAIAGHCLSVIEHYELTRDDVVLQFSSHGFDAALEQILPALVSGARLVLRGDEVWPPDDFRAVVDAHRITVADLPPAYLRELFQAWVADPGQAPVHSPRLVIAGGEELAPETVRLWQASPFAPSRLLNAYGPTEATITCTVHEVSADPPGSSIPIGRPLACGEVYILDRDGNPVPEGVPGELYIGGTRLACGYSGADELTGARFVPNPFAADEVSARLYRTGDIASFIPGSDGLIAFRGRVDHQVKICGFRIELGEIESALRAFGLRDTVVIARPKPGGERQLVAYVVPRRQDFVEQELIAYLSARLPAYMIPSAYICLPALPTTPGGKLDRASLPEIADVDRTTAVAPRDAVEERLARIWRQVLGLDSVSVFDNFFACGGHSLLCVRLLAAIRREFGRDLSIASLIHAPTLAEQARILDSRTGAGAAKAASTGAGSPLVLLSGHDRGTPLFCVHPIGGSVLCYVDLARQLEVDRPIYGVQAPALDGGPNPGSIQAMAETYVAAIRAVQPEGPYHLAGWSMGGVIAFEMAQQLRGDSQRVPLLALIDSYTPALLETVDAWHPAGCNDPQEGLLRAFAGDLLGLGGEAVRLPANAPPEVMLDQFLGSPAAKMLLAGMSRQQKRRLFEVFQSNSLALLAILPSLTTNRSRFSPRRRSAWPMLPAAGAWLREVGLPCTRCPAITTRS